jgi:hypothetical protein
MLNKMNIRWTPTKRDLENDLKRNLEYLNDTNSKNWGGSEENAEKESILHHISWIQQKLKNGEYQ